LHCLISENVDTEFPPRKRVDAKATPNKDPDDQTLQQSSSPFSSTTIKKGSSSRKELNEIFKNISGIENPENDLPQTDTDSGIEVVGLLFILKL
jgi:hypothetical protein